MNHSSSLITLINVSLYIMLFIFISVSIVIDHIVQDLYSFIVPLLSYYNCKAIDLKAREVRNT